MASRAARLVGTAIAYIVAGIPALIGIGFVARYAYVTSDTPTDGAATAFLFGMVATGAFAGPAIAVAVKNRGRKTAALVWWALAMLAIIANWTHTLGAIAQRGAGIEARGAKITADTEADRKTLARLERELGALKFAATSAEAVAAAKSAAELAEHNRKAECGPNNETRGERCRARELEEQAKRDALAKAVSDKAATDRATQLAAEAAELRRSLAAAPVTPSTNALSSALGRMLAIPAMTAATIQQGFVSAIVELLIAAVLALPELLRSKGPVGAIERRQAEDLVADDLTPAAEVLAPVPQQNDTLRRPSRAIAKRDAVQEPLDDAIDPKPVIAFLAEHVLVARGSRADWGDIYSGFREWQAQLGHDAWPATQFGAVLRHICDQANIRVRRQGDRVFCLDRRFTWTG
jgi:hypothetical protein